MQAAADDDRRTLTLVVGVGYLGRRVLEAAEPGTVIGLSRSARPTLPMVETLDLEAGKRLPLTLPDSYHVLYTVPPAQGREQDVRLENLLAALDPAPAAFVYISTTGVYGDHGGAVVDERTPVNPQSDRAERRVTAETRLVDWCADKGTRLCILRVPGIYGPGRLGTERIREGLPVISEADAGPGNRIHVEDLVSCCLAALARDTAAGVFNVGDGDHRSATWFSGEVARQAGLPAPPTISLEEAAQTFSPMRMSFLRESRTVATERMREELGVTPRFSDAADGIRASLALE